MREAKLPQDWDKQLYTPPQSVSKQEHAQIEAKIEGWARSLAVSHLIKM